MWFIKKNRILNILLNSKKEIFQRDFKILQSLCMETLKTKIHFLKNDIYENGSRLYLNFGHTFAHAFEMATEQVLNKELLRHGEAVGVGMLCEILLSAKKKFCLFFVGKNIEIIFAPN